MGALDILINFTLPLRSTNILVRSCKPDGYARVSLLTEWRTAVEVADTAAQPEFRQRDRIVGPCEDSCPGLDLAGKSTHELIA
jgi:hypothetical protein